MLWYVPEQILMRINNQSKRKRCKWSPKINFFLSWLDIPYSDHARYLYVEVRKKFQISYSLKTVYISSTKKTTKEKFDFIWKFFTHLISLVNMVLTDYISFLSSAYYLTKSIYILTFFLLSQKYMLITQGVRAFCWRSTSRSMKEEKRL